MNGDIIGAIICCLILLIIMLISIVKCRKMYDAKRKEKKARDNDAKRFGAIMHNSLIHIEGLPLANGVYVEVYYGPEKIVFKKDQQEISVATDKITSIDCVIKNGRSKKISAMKTYLVISYISSGKNKHIKLDAAYSGTFVIKVEKDFKKCKTVARSVEL